MKAIKIGIADGQALFRTGLALVLKNEPHFEVVCTFSQGDEVLPTLATHCVDVLLLDLDLPKCSGLEVIKQLGRECPEIQILVLSTQARLSVIAELLRLGAAGFLPKQCSTDELKTAILQVRRTGYYLNALAAKAQLRRYARKPAQKAITPRERQVLDLICRELSSTEIAAQLQLSPRTIEGYRKSLIAKTGARNLAGLVLYAVREGMV